MPSRGTVRIGTAFGIPVLVHASWLIAFGLAVLSLGHELHGSVATRWILALGTALAFFASVIVHELAHSVVALRFGIPVRSITLFVFGGLATLGAEPKRPRDELLVAAAGPFASIAIGAASWALARLAPAAIAEPLAWLGRVNVALAVFNCLPGFPLDGGRMLRAVLWARGGDEATATRRAANAGRVLAYGFLGLGVWSATTGSMASGLWIAFIGWFLLQAAQASLDDVVLRSAIEGLSAEDVMTRQFPSVSGGLDVATYVEGVVFPSGDRMHLVRGADAIRGLVTLDRVLAVPRLRWRAATVGDVAIPITEVPRVEASTPVADVLRAMDDAPLALVVDHDGLAGVVERQHLLGLVETRVDIVANPARASRVGPWKHAAAMIAFASAIALVGGCDARAPARDRADPAPAAVASPPAPSIPLQCATLRDVDESDVVRVDGDRVYYADEGSGLVALDLADPDRPRVLGASAFVGTPLAVHLQPDAAWVVFVDWDGRALPRGGIATVIRAVSRERDKELRVLGEIALPGIARGVTLVGDALYVLREREGDHASVTSFRLRSGVLGTVDDVAVEGAPQALAASAAGLAAFGRSDGTAITWIDLPLERPGAMRVHASVHVAGALAEGRAVDADEDRRVRAVTCAGDACSLHVIGFGGPGGEPLASLEVTKHGGVPVARFADDTLFVAEPATGDRPGGVATTDLRVVRTEDPRRPRIVARIPLRGAIRALAAREGRLVALGTVGSSATAVRLAVHDVDVREPASPRLRGTVTFGADWTWSVAEDTDRAVSFDPAASLVAIPFTAFTAADRRYETGTQVVVVGEGRPRLGPAPRGDGVVERAVFHRGRLVTIGPEGVKAIPYLDTGAEKRGTFEVR